MTPTIQWNPKVKLIISDVDETIADLYVKATPQMIEELTKLLKVGFRLFLVSGQGLESIQWRIIDYIPHQLRHQIIIAHCSGSEIWGFQRVSGARQNQPFYSLVKDKMTPGQLNDWRTITQQLIEEFHLKISKTMPAAQFIQESQGDPLTIMFEDRGPQITMEVVNGFALTDRQAKDVTASVSACNMANDLRIPIMERSHTLLQNAGLPITARLGGVFALDFTLEGVSKTTAVRYVLAHPDILSTLDLIKSDVSNPEQLEIWGDKFSVISGGTDRHMSEAVDPKVRSIDFRNENPEEFPQGFNIVLWDGSKHLHEGLLEFLTLSQNAYDPWH